MSSEIARIDQAAFVIFASTRKLEEIFINRHRLLSSIELTREAMCEQYFTHRREQLGKKVVGYLPEGRTIFDCFSEEDCRAVVAHQVDQEIGKARGTLDAATIVFSHSVFEELVCNLFELDYEMNPATWQAQLGQRSVELTDALRLSPDELRKLAWDKIRKEIEHKQLIKNVNVLIARCQAADPERHDDLRRAHRLDLARLVEIDKMRQSLVHRPQPAAPIAEVEDTFDYLSRVTIMIANLVMNCLLGTGMMMSGLSGMHNTRAPKRLCQ